MRIGTDAFFDSMSRTLARLQRDLGELTVAMSRGRRLAPPSDDPTAAAVVARAKTEARAAASRDKILERAQWTTRAADAALDQIAQALAHATDIALQATEPGHQSPEVRQSTAAQLRGVREMVLLAANSAQGDRYLFAGYEDRTQPFVVNPVTGKVEYRGDSGQLTAPLGAGRTCPISVPGDRLMNMGGGHMPGVSRDVFSLLDDLADAVEEGDTATVRQLRDELRAAQAAVVEERGLLGACEKRLQTARDALEDTQALCAEIVSREEGLDLAEALSEYAARETSYKAALNVFSRILSLPTVFDLTR